ncbi:flagellar hook-length control protein FliK [Halovibrio sp. HP20-50]|uniref:flagellar hook-length control protein FliK n=1 Tax=Halovibrio sp. HP20-59 TaxID=3080275 RepID=UPI00294B231B|nr:flagellar hook-length control protein FliK [Halovibrio sp. HP20-59]MEA2119487.1 flagellar hook-length control protein FliK [Halovibrio sp. HP20-59]
MSGINPLIDTLLHQVLGRQGEVSLQRVLEQPVKPIPPGEGPRALKGDANLDGRPSTSPLNDLKRLPLPGEGGRTLPRGDALTSPPGSTQTHFSPAARTIADVLLRFPAPPSVMRPEAPLVTSQEAPSASAVATRLEASIRDSGLFYEAHLKRWFQGAGTRQQLLNEPQMQAGPRPPAPPASLLPTGLNVSQALNGLAPLATPGASMSGQGGMSILPNVPLVPIASEAGLVSRAGIATASTQPPAGSTQAPAAAPQTTVSMAGEGRENGQSRVDLSHPREMTELMANRSGRDVVHESLQSLVRQQLEMLVMPTIRWEGDVWAGIFMALVINLPAREEGQEGGQQEGEPDGGWRSDMQLEVPNLGAFNASLWLYKNALSIDFTTESTKAYERIDAGLPALEKRLGALDLQKVQLRARYLESEDVHGNFG